MEKTELLDKLHEQLECRFNERNECLTHRTEHYPRGYDEPTCSVADKMLELMEEVDRNGRAYGYEVGKHGTIDHEIISGPDNPFIDSDWRERNGVPNG